MKHWTDSKTIRYLAVTWVVGLLMALAPMLEKHQIDWWALGAYSASNLAGIIVRMFADDVEGPLPMMNRSGGGK